MDNSLLQQELHNKCVNKKQHGKKIVLVCEIQ